MGLMSAWVIFYLVSFLHIYSSVAFFLPQHHATRPNLLPRASLSGCSPSDANAIMDLFAQLVQLAWAGEQATITAEWSERNEETLRRHVNQQTVTTIPQLDPSTALLAAHMITAHVRFAAQFNFSPGPDTTLTRRYFRNIHCVDIERRCSQDPEAIAYRATQNLVVLCRDRFFALDPLEGSNSVRDRVSALFAMLHEVGMVEERRLFYYVPELNDPIAPYITFSKEMLRIGIEANLGLRFGDVGLS